MRTLVLALAVLLLSGCDAGTAFRMDAYNELGNVITSMDTGAAEAQAGLSARLDAEQELRKAALAASLKQALALTPEEQEAAIDTKLEKYHGQVSAMEEDRARATERFRRMTEWSSFGKLLLARLMTLERQSQSVEQQLAEYRQLAEMYAREALGLSASKPEGVTP